MTSRLLHSQDFAISLFILNCSALAAISLFHCLFVFLPPFPIHAVRQSTFPFKDFSPSVLSDSHCCLSSSSLSLPPSQSIPFQSPFFSPFSIFSPLLIVTHHPPLSSLVHVIQTQTHIHSTQIPVGHLFRLHSLSGCIRMHSLSLDRYIQLHRFIDLFSLSFSRVSLQHSSSFLLFPFSSQQMNHPPFSIEFEVALAFRDL